MVKKPDARHLDKAQINKNAGTVDFAHLHLHTNFSMLDGAVCIDDLFSRCFELGIKAVAITDHGNMYGVIEFIKAAVRFSDPGADFLDFLSDGREFLVQPIVGCEFYITSDMSIKNPLMETL